MSNWSCLFLLAACSFLFVGFVQCSHVNRSDSRGKRIRHVHTKEARRIAISHHYVNGTKPKTIHDFSLSAPGRITVFHHDVNGTKPKTNQHSPLLDAVVSVSGGCATAHLSGESSSSETPIIPEIRWMETPSVVRIRKGHFRVLGRSVHLNYVKEQLISQGVSFAAQREEQPSAVSVEILADSLFIQGRVQLFGVQALNIYTRKIITAGDGVLDVSAPSWNQVYEWSRPSPGRRSEDGFHGIHGPQVEIYADVIQGSLQVISNGGNGFRGQDGAAGVDAADNSHVQPDNTASDCTRQSSPNCNSLPARVGQTGYTGGDGGDAGLSGNGGNSGTQRVLVNTVEGSVELRTCRGNGAPAASNGQGGSGGRGGEGSYGRRCSDYQEPGGYYFTCRDSGRTSSRGRRGVTGDSGSPGTTPVRAGSPGSVAATGIQSREMDDTDKHSYPMALLRLSRRHAEDLLWADNLNEGRQVLRFIKAFTRERTDATAMFKEARRRLGLLGKAGFDLFGYNELFAPRIKWETLKDVVENLREIASTYEDAYNRLSETIEADGSFEQIARQMSAVAGKQVEAEKERLKESQLIAESQKRVYVRAIGDLENRMDGILQSILAVAEDVIATARFNEDDLLAVLQAVCGFTSAAITLDPLGLVDAALGVAFMGDNRCPLGTLQYNTEKFRKWLTFGKRYQELEDSSDLDFDQVEVETVPEVMQSNLEMNKEGLAADLVCLLDVRSREQDVAELKKLMEHYFISGAARIDLIAKVIDLDNDLGGLIFDIPLLETTEDALTTLTESTGCQEALGMESGSISDEQVSASSRTTSRHAAKYGRLHSQLSTGAWSSASGSLDANQWLQVDLLSQFIRVTRVATQGRYGHDQWVTSYNLQYSDDGVNFQYYTEPGQTANKVFAGNSDRSTVVSHDLNSPIEARYIRFRPLAWYAYISMRVELYGCQDTPTMNEVRSEFMENLLGIYQELEGSFMKELYSLYKAFRFRTLWETENPLPEFQRVASEGAQGGTLNGIIELTNVVRDIQNMETTAVKCFTNNIYTTDIQRWSFAQVTDSTMFENLHTGGSTTFNIRVTNSCPTCFNVRLLELYIELTGDEAQPANVPLTVHLQVRHLSASFFRHGNGTMVEFRQPLGSFRKMKFRRSAISNEVKCGEKEMEGNKNSIFCVTPNDDRWHGMCSLSQLHDRLLGEEECRSPFGTYELVIPVNDELSCDEPGLTSKNCRDLNLSRFTRMNVWAQFYYWDDVYPTGPDDPSCLSPVSPGVI